MNKLFETPEVEQVKFDAVDVITASGFEGEEGDTPGMPI